VRTLVTIAILIIGFYAVPASAQDTAGPAPKTTFQALSGLQHSPAALSDRELANIEGGLANANALPPNNPGTARASGFPNPGTGTIPSQVFFDHVQNQWFGRAAQ
jgi:hypothetical protein